ncbi:transcriptional regulator, XRE family [Chitinophaga pinensis DSM 2588]|uniref:Transcriptional regulator, XRE family n=2 Tax=Chitinophaga pinensis TaxID=79329 RepID=A0A979G6S7_CHIPD|nr:transcriptional regulator, XRE family [Chitinophaga pinensis DSM 2588]
MNIKSPLDQYVIEKVKEMRTARKVSQIDLSQGAGFNDAFVGHCENPKRREKYNLQHLNAIAKFFGCSIKDFIPDAPL